MGGGGGGESPCHYWKMNGTEILGCFCLCVYFGRVVLLFLCCCFLNLVASNSFTHFVSLGVTKRQRGLGMRHLATLSTFLDLT